MPEFTAQVVERLRKASDLVRENLRVAAENASRWYNRRVKPRQFVPGDAVGIFYPRRFVGRTPKWQNFFKTEGRVLQRLNDATYLVEARSWKGPKIVHAEKSNRFYRFSNSCVAEINHVLMCCAIFRRCTHVLVRGCILVTAENVMNRACMWRPLYMHFAATCVFITGNGCPSATSTEG